MNELLAVDVISYRTVVRTRLLNIEGEFSTADVLNSGQSTESTVSADSKSGQGYRLWTGGLTVSRCSRDL
jgi:hypothetical protein